VDSLQKNRYTKAKGVYLSGYMKRMNEKEIQQRKVEIIKEMTKIEKDYNSEAITSPSQLIEQICTARAELQDIQAIENGKVAESVYSLGVVSSSKKAADAYTRGKEGDLRVPLGEVKDEDTLDVMKLIMKNCPDENIADPRMIRQAVGSTPQLRSQSKSLEQDLYQADIPDHVLTLLWLERIRRAARENLMLSLLKLLKPELKLTADTGMENFWQLKFLNEDDPSRGLSFLCGFIERVEFETASAAQAIYGAHADRALSQWRMLLSIKLERGVAPEVKKMRRRCADALRRHDFDEAGRILEEKIKSPLDGFNKNHAPHAQTVGLKPKLTQRFENELAQSSIAMGDMYKTKGGRIARIKKIGTDIRHTEIGHHSGIEIAYLIRDPKNPLTGGIVEGKTEILSLRQLQEKMKKGEWQRTDTADSDITPND